MRTDMTITLQEGLKRLKLRRISDTYEGYNQTALAEQWSYLDFLTTLVKEEIASREHTGYEKRLKAAHFPSKKTLEDFDFEFQRSVLKPKIMDLARLDFIGKAENVVLIGPPGVGKTHLAIALGIKAVQVGYRVLFTTAQDLVDELYASLADGSFKSRMRSLMRADLLILDEVGFTEMDATASNHFFQVVSQAYERRSLILTSNRPFQEWGNLFATVTIATAILDRLLHHAHIFSLKGDSYRLKGAAKVFSPSNSQVPEQ